MQTMNDLRKKIDSIDTDIQDLIKERLDLSKQIAELKRNSNASVFQKERENDLLTKHMKNADSVDPNKIAALFRTIMRLSREQQYQYLMRFSSLSFDPSNLNEERVDKAIKVYYPGNHSSYSYAAVLQMYPSANAENLGSFEDVFQKVEEDALAIGVLPIENSTAGVVAEVYDGLMRHQVYINHLNTVSIQHCLLTRHGVDLSRIDTVYSHPQALSQCSRFLHNGKYKLIAVSNTAEAARLVSESSADNIAAIASRAASDQYDLQILHDSINDYDNNSTRFISVSKRLYSNSSDNRVVILTILPHRTGALSDVLSVFADYAINLTQIHARPRPKHSWEYCFYLSFEGNLQDESIQTILYQLKEELPFIKVLGTYYEESGLNNGH